MSGSNRSAGILLNYLTEGVRILSALLVTPWVLRLLGQREYGVYQLAVSAVSWLSLLDLGFGSSYLRGFSRCGRQGTEASLARFHGMYLLLYGALAALSLLCGGLLAMHPELVLGSLSAEAEKSGSRLLMILTLNLSLTLLNMPFDGYLAAREQFAFQKLLRLVQSVLHPVLSLPLLLRGHGAEGLALISLILTAAVLAGNAYHCLRRLRMPVSFDALPISQLRGLWAFAFFIFLNQIIDQVNWSVDKLLLGHLDGAAAVAVYGVGGQLHALYRQLSTGISTVFLPKVNRIAARTVDNRELSRLMAQVGRVQGMVLMLPLSGFALFGRAFLTLWAGKAYVGSYWVALLLMGSVTIPLMQNLGIEIQRARNAHCTRSVVYACLAVGNVACSCLLIPRWGPAGAAAGTAASLIVGNVLFMNWYYQKRLKLDMGHYWRRILQLVPAWAAACVAGIGIARLWEITGWGSFFLAAAAYSAVYGAALWGLGLRDEEKRWILSLCRKKKEGQA